MIWSLYVLLGAALVAFVSALTCRDENNQPVDSWVILKVNNNAAYFYYNASSGSFQLSKYNVLDYEHGALMNTLAPIYRTNVTNKIAFAMYNDDTPSGQSASSTYAHAKGILATDSISGFWIVHSMPGWPNAYNASAILTGSGPGPFPDTTYGKLSMNILFPTYSIFKTPS